MDPEQHDKIPARLSNSQGLSEESRAAATVTTGMPLMHTAAREAGSLTSA